MARPMSELEYVQALVDGHARVFWHSLPQEPDPGAMPDLVKDALYRAVAQALRERAGMPLPPNRHQFDCILSAARRRDLNTYSPQVMNPPADEAEAGNLVHGAPRQADPAAPGRGKSGLTSGSEARPVTPTEQPS